MVPPPPPVLLPSAFHEFAYAVGEQMTERADPSSPSMDASQHMVLINKIDKNRLLVQTGYAIFLVLGVPLPVLQNYYGLI